jgi:hypothetical protein
MNVALKVKQQGGMIMGSELLTAVHERNVRMTVRLELTATIYDAYREAAKLARELGKRWAPEEAIAKWLGEQTMAALQELRHEKQRRAEGDKQRSAARA